MPTFLKFLVVGTIGFLVNTVGLVVGVKLGLKPSIAGPLGAEFAILSNFILNNFWTFSDKTLTSWTVIPMKFLQFNVLSLGSVVIQFIFLKIGEIIFGMKEFKLPVLESPKFLKMPIFGALIRMVKKIVYSLPFGKKFTDKFSAYMVFYMLGVGVGLVWNFIMYSRVIWR
jgi:putative flippase GtrA